MTEEERFYLSISPFAMPKLFDIELKEHMAIHTHSKRQIQFHKGDLLYKEGTVLKKVYYVEKGFSVDVALTLTGLERYYLGFPDCFLGLTCCCHAQPVLPKTVALCDLTAYMYDYDELLDIISSDKALLKKSLSIMALEARSGNSLNLHQQTSSGFERVCQVIYCYDIAKKYFPQLNDLLISQQLLAGLTGVHRVSVAKAINQLKALNIVIWKRNHPVIKDIDQLKTIAFQMYPACD